MMAPKLGRVHDKVRKAHGYTSKISVWPTSKYRLTRKGRMYRSRLLFNVFITQNKNPDHQRHIFYEKTGISRSQQPLGDLRAIKSVSYGPAVWSQDSVISTKNVRKTPRL